MKSVSLQDYTIIIDEDLSDLKQWLKDQSYSNYYILVDEHTEVHCWPILKPLCSDTTHEIIRIKSGEQYKNLTTCSEIWQHLLSVKADRNALFINLGGGVIGDMGGFAASCYKRGIDFINIPTTVLSQVDASIGGKLGVDFNNGKNLIGLFKNPQRVHIATCFHATLPDRQIRNGMAEVYKHALIADKDQWKKLMENDDVLGKDAVTALYESLLVKKRIVEEDPFEKGIRKALNFGHTIGHAIETYSLERDEDPLFHGEAIAIGMVMEAYLSFFKCQLRPAHLEDITTTLFSRYDAYEIDLTQIDQIWDYMLLDKKNEGSTVLAALISDIGQPVLNVEISMEDLILAIAYYESCKE